MAVRRLDPPPDDWRDREVESDPDLLAEEKELNLTFPNDGDHGYLYADVPVFIRWLQSIPPADPEWVRVNDEGALLAVSATIPKGIVKLQKQTRKSQTHSSMVSYGPLD